MNGLIPEAYAQAGAASPGGQLAPLLMMVLAKPKASVAANAMNKRRSQQPRTGRVLSGFTPTHIAPPFDRFTAHAHPMTSHCMLILNPECPSHPFPSRALPTCSHRMPLQSFHAA